MPDVVCVVWAGLLEVSPEVVGRRLRLMLVAMGSSHDAPCAGASRLLVVVVIIVGCDRSP
jgi:hypothetical protein